MDGEFRVIGAVRRIRVIARGSGIRELAKLSKLFGEGNWRKLDGEALVRLPNGHTRLCEVHWYEAHGIGRKRLKIKQFLDERR
jgi:hypothetical protein